MKAEILSRFDLVWMPAIAFFIFATVFCGVLYYILKDNSKNYFDKLAHIPLNDEGK